MGDRRRLARHLAGAIASAVLISSPVALVSPAGADIDRGTVAISDGDVHVGQSFRITGRVVDNTTGAPCSGGTTTLYRDPAGDEGPRALATDTDGGSFRFDLRATTNADYILHYATNGSAGCPADQGYFVQRVYRRMPSDVDRRAVMRGSVAPAWRRKPVVVQVKRGGRWVTHHIVRTDRRSRYSVKLFARRGKVTHFRAFVKASTSYQKSFTDRWDLTYARSRNRGVTPQSVVARSVTGQPGG